MSKTSRDIFIIDSQAETEFTNRDILSIEPFEISFESFCWAISDEGNETQYIKEIEEIVGKILLLNFRALFRARTKI